MKLRCSVNEALKSWTLHYVLLFHLLTTTRALVLRQASDSRFVRDNQEPNVGHVIETRNTLLNSTWRQAWDRALNAQQEDQLVDVMRLARASLHDPAARGIFEEVKGAIKVLSEMATEAQKRVDAKSLVCKQEEEENDRLQKAVQQDLSRITQQQLSLRSREVSVRTSLDAVDAQRQVAKERQVEIEKTSTRGSAARLDSLAKTKKNMEVSEFILDLTKCQAAALIDLNGKRDSSSSNHAQPQGRIKADFKVCGKPGSASKAEVEVEFGDKQLQNLTSRLTMEGQWQLQLALSRSRLSSRSPFGQLFSKDGSLDLVEDGDGLNLLRKTQSTGQQPIDQHKAHRCTMQAEPECGEMHDVFADLWGDMRDSADDLEAQVKQDEEQKVTLQSSYQHTLESISGNEAVLKANLVDISSLQGELGGQHAAKQREAKSFEAFSSKAKEECTNVLSETTDGEMCRVRTLRSDLAKAAGLPNPTDCEVSEWVRDGSCSKRCGGGTQRWKRKVLKPGSALGASCPPLQQEIACNVFGCPVDCKLSTWARWSDCTTACGGGIRYRTRSRLVNPKYGGFACDVMQETQQCNTQSCDRNCKLGEWSAFSECSQACDGGFTQRRTSVLRPEIGAGTCPEASSKARLDRKQCNENKCIGDEVCLSKVDVIIAIDGSGSLTSKGFKIMQNFAARLARRFHSGARIGLVQFGNGALDDKKVVADVWPVYAVNGNTQQVASAILGLKWQKGFTNLAQAAMKSRDLLSMASPRPDAKSLAIFLTDGRPSFKTMASRAMTDLKKSARVMMVQVKPFPENHNMELLKSYATEPAEANYMHIPGKESLKRNYDKLVTKVIAQACQSVESPSAKAKAAEQAA